MNIEDYKLYRKHGFALFRTEHYYSIYINHEDLDIKIVYEKHDGFLERKKEILINELVELQQNFKDDIHNPNRQIAQMNVSCVNKLEEIINDYNDVKEIFDNYASLTVDLETALETKKNKRIKI